MMSPMRQPAHVVFAEERALAAVPESSSIVHARRTPETERRKDVVFADADAIAPVLTQPIFNKAVVATITAEPNKDDLDRPSTPETEVVTDLTINNGAIRHFSKWTSNDFRKGGSLLYLAMSENQPEVVDALIDQGYSVDIRHSNFETPLHLAIRTGNVGLVTKLLAANASVDVSGPSSYCALHYAAHYNQPEIAEILLSQPNIGVDDCTTSVQQTPLYIAARDGHAGVVDVLIKANANLNHHERNLGYTSLHVAARFNRPATIQALLSSGTANTDARDNEGLTPLMLAAKCGMSAAALALSKSEDVDHDARCGMLSTIGFGWNAADIATYYGHVDLSIALSQPLKNEKEDHKEHINI
eukprot:m.50604 g.50604  ORF g.50604 m.50604 type:complete len:358 (-) comp21317_c0_seq1:106-1179(-)